MSLPWHVTCATDRLRDRLATWHVPTRPVPPCRAFDLFPDRNAKRAWRYKHRTPCKPDAMSAPDITHLMS